jgi:hypothetical protein
MRFMSDELRYRRSPSDIMLYLAQQEEALVKEHEGTPRDVLCPCCSGKKHKNYHGKR